MPKFSAFLFLSLALFGAGCSPADPITNKFTCHEVCQRYAGCFNKDYDVSGCTSSCESEAANGDDKQTKLDDCHSCIGDKSSVSDFANCSGSCGTFIAN